MPTIRFVRDTRSNEAAVMHHEGDIIEVTAASAQRWQKRGAAEMVDDETVSIPPSNASIDVLRSHGVRALRRVAQDLGVSTSGRNKEELVQAIAATSQLSDGSLEVVSDPAIASLMEQDESTLRNEAEQLGVEGADALGKADLAAAVRDARRRFGDEADGPEPV